MNPNCGTKLHTLGTLRCKLNDFDEGIRFLERALEYGSKKPRLEDELELARNGIFLEEATCDPLFEVKYGVSTGQE